MADDTEREATQRAKARRTAWLLAVAAAVVYGLFVGLAAIR